MPLISIQIKRYSLHSKYAVCKEQNFSAASKVTKDKMMGTPCS